MRTPLSLRWWRVPIIMVVLAALTASWAALLAHNLARGEALFGVVTAQDERNLLALSADFLEYRDYYRAFPERPADASAGSVFVEYYKRPLYGPVSAGLSMLAAALGVDFPTRMFVILGLYAAAATMLLFAVMRSLGLPILESALITAIGTLSFAWGTVFSLPESYSLSVCSALIVALHGVRLPEIDAPGGIRAAVRHGVLAGIGAWIYLPVCGGVLLLASRISRRSDLLRVLAPVSLLAAVLAWLPHLLAGPQNMDLQFDYASRWVSAGNLLDVSSLAAVFVAFLFFGLVAPTGDFLEAAPSVSVPDAFYDASTLAGVVGVAMMYGLLFRQARRIGNGTAAAGPLLWLAGLIVFHVLYNPGEVLLYLSIPTAVLLVTIGCVRANVVSVDPRRDGMWIPMLAVLVVLLAVVNASAVLGA